MKKIFLSLELILVVFFLVSCDFIKTQKFRVTFKDGNIIFKQAEYKENSLIEDPGNPEKSEHSFLGWFKNLDESNSKWNFETDKITSHLELYASWEEIYNEYKIENLRVEDKFLRWDLKDGLSYKILFDDKNYENLNGEFDLSIYKSKFINGIVNFSIFAVKDGKNVYEKKFKINYTAKKEENVLNFDFENNTKADYAEKEIAIDDYQVMLSGALIGTLASDVKNGNKSLRIKSGGFIEFDVELKGENKLSFNFANYKGDKGSNIIVNIKDEKNNNDEIIIEPNEIDDVFKLKEILINDKFINKKVKIKITSQNTANEKRVNIDDIIITTNTNEKYTFENELEIDYLPYYQTLIGKSGKKLIDELRIILATNIVKVNYGDVRYLLIESDVDSNDDNKSLRGIYDGAKHLKEWKSEGTGAWEREHVWPNSRLGIKRVTNNQVNQASDPHNLRVITGSTNRSRLNNYFLENTSKDKLNKRIGAKGYYPGDNDKGDVARILLYMAVRYEFLNLTSNLNILDNALAYKPSGAYMGNLDVLLSWHNSDKVDQFEKNRNNVIYNKQKNRNPFIDHPELFEEVYNYFKSIDNKEETFINLVIKFEINYSDLLKFRKIEI